MTQIERAIRFATWKHAGQVDKVGKPYILHPLRVMARVYPAGEAAMCAAVLHDVVEDCGVTRAQLEARFSEEVVEAVMLLSRPAAGTPDRPTHADYVRAIAQSGSWIAVCVKRADLEDNLMRTHELPPEQRGISKRYHQGMRILDGRE
ncbi:MAG: HD domain-containing protein [bacterium]